MGAQPGYVLKNQLFFYIYRVDTNLGFSYIYTFL